MARRLGYVEQTKLLRVGRDTAHLRFVLEPTANQLDTVRVQGIAGTWQADFLRRQALGLGQFFTQADILAAHADRLASLLRNAHGLIVTPQRDGGADQINIARSAGDCSSVSIYLDGVLMNGTGVVQTAMVTKQQDSKNGPHAANPGNPPPPPPSQNPPAQPPPTAKPTARIVYQATQNESVNIDNTPPPIVMGTFDVNSIPLSFLAGIEVYTNSATIPPEYQRRSNACGVILLWTK